MTAMFETWHFATRKVGDIRAGDFIVVEARVLQVLIRTPPQNVAADGLVVFEAEWPRNGTTELYTYGKNMDIWVAVNGPDELWCDTELVINRWARATMPAGSGV